MKVTGLDLYEVEVPMRRPFRSSRSSTSTLRHLVVCLEGEGCAGWGEAPTAASPLYLGETPETAWEIVRTHLAPLVLGIEWEAPGDLARILDQVKGNTCARAAVESAGWDLWCRSRGISLAEALSSSAGASPDTPAGAHPENPSDGPLRVPAGIAIGLHDDIDDLLGEVAAWVDAGYQRVKIKIAPGCDVVPLRRVRERFPDLLLVADANGAYGLDRAGDLDALRALDEVGLAAIEQPLAEDDLIGHARLAEILSTPIALDESIASPGDLHTASALGSCRAVSIKVARLGGVQVALDLLSAVRKAGIDAWCGGLHELGVGRAVNAALASLPGFTVPGDLSVPEHYAEDGLVVPALSLDDGNLLLPGGAGIGVWPDGDSLRRVLCREVRLEA